MRIQFNHFLNQFKAGQLKNRQYHYYGDPHGFYALITLWNHSPNLHSSSHCESCPVCFMSFPFPYFVRVYMEVYCNKIYSNQYNKHLDHRAISAAVDVILRVWIMFAEQGVVVVQDTMVLWSGIIFCWRLSQQLHWLPGSWQLALAGPVCKPVFQQRQFRLLEAPCIGVADMGTGSFYCLCYGSGSFQ